MAAIEGLLIALDIPIGVGQYLIGNHVVRQIELRLSSHSGAGFAGKPRNVGVEPIVTRTYTFGKLLRAPASCQSVGLA